MSNSEEDPEPTHLFSVEQEIGPWVVQLSWRREAEQGGPTQVLIRPHAEAQESDLSNGISSTVLRQIDFQAAADHWRAAKTNLDKRSEEASAYRQGLLKMLIGMGITDDYLAWLSRIYVDLVMEGERSVTARLAEMTGKSAETMRAHLKEARKREMLTTVKGKAGGALTDKAKRITKGENIIEMLRRMNG